MIIGGIPMMTITTIGQAQGGRREPNPGTIVQQNRTVQVVNGNLLVQLASHFLAKKVFSFQLVSDPQAGSLLRMKIRPRGGRIIGAASEDRSSFRRASIPFFNMVRRADGPPTGAVTDGPRGKV